MYTPLYVKTNYSFLTSLVRIDDYINYALKYNLKSISITDTNMISTMNFYKKCIKNNIKPVIGLSTIYKDKVILIYAKNHDGYKYLININLNKIVNYKDLETNKDNIIIVLPYDSKDLYDELKELNTYIGFSSSKEMNELESITKRLVFSNEVLYLDKKDSDYYKYLIMLKDKKNVMDDIKFSDNNNYLNKYEEVINIAKKEYIDNTNKISDSINLEIDKKENLIPIYDNKKNVDSDTYLKELSIKGLSIRLDNNVTDIYKDRLLYELDVIKNMGYSDYFLIVYDYVKYAKKKNILVGPGRGSAMGSLVAYSLGIIDFDPIKYNLLFERFLNPERVSMPDIDVDFPDAHREEVINYVKEKYGEKKVAGIIGVGTYRAKAVLDDVGKALKIDPDKIARLKRFITKDDNKLKDIYEHNKDFKNIIDNDDRLSLLYDVSLKLEDFPRNTTTHASGILISKKDLDEIIPLMYENDKLTSSFEGIYLEDLGLLKMDFLGLANLTTIMNIIEDVKSKENIDIDFANIPLDDKDTFKMFNDVDTNGIFQFDGAAGKALLSKIKVKSFDDLVAINALARPGPDSETYIYRRNNNINIKYPNKEIEEILGSTYGVLIYQEQIMLLARTMAGFTMSEADNLRRAMSKKKKEELVKWKEKFINGSIKNDYSKEYTEKMYNDILPFAEYGFNKSHAVAYAGIAYKMAYLKAHFSKYFYLNTLSRSIGNDKDTNVIIKEAKKRGIEFLLPDINKSTDEFVIEDDKVRFPLSNIKNIGRDTAKEIVSVREKGFTDIYDAIVKLNKIKINRRVLENLIYSGCFDSFGLNKKTIIENLDNILTYAYVASGIDSDILEKPSIEEKEEYDSVTLMNYEKELFGFYITHHPVTLYKDKLKVIDINKVKDYFGRVIDTLILVDKVKTHKDKNNNEMAFISGSDETGDIEYICFSKVFSTINEVKKGDILLVRGRVEKKANYQILADIAKIVNK